MAAKREEPKTLGEQIRDKLTELQQSGSAEAASMADFMDDVVSDFFEEGLHSEQIRTHLIGVCDEFRKSAGDLKRSLSAMEDE
jgi:hypothetical protein